MKQFATQGLALAAAVSAMAASQVDLQVPRDATRQTSIQNAPTLMAHEAERIRVDLLETMNVYLEIMRDSRTQNQIQEAMGVIATLSTDGLSAFAPATAELSQWKSTTMALRDLIVAKESGTAAVFSRATTATNAFPNADYSDTCGKSRNMTEVVSTWKDYYQKYRAFWAVQSRICDEVAFGFSLPAIVCIAFDEIYYGIQTTYENLAFCDRDVDSAEILGTYERVGYLHREVVALDEKVTGLDQKIDELDERLKKIDAKIDALGNAVDDIRKLNCEVIRLLNTPEGRRSSSMAVCSDQPGYPYNFPNNSKAATGTDPKKPQTKK